MLGLITGTLSAEEAMALALAIEPRVTSVANPEMGEALGGETTLASGLADLVKAYYDALGAEADPVAAAAAVRLGFFPPDDPVALARLVFDLTAGRLADSVGVVEAGARLARALAGGEGIEDAAWGVLAAAAAFLPFDKIGQGAMRLLKGGTRLGIETLRELTLAARAGGRALGEVAGSTGTAVSRAVTEGVEAATGLARRAGQQATGLARQGGEALARAWRETRQQLDQAFGTWRRKGAAGTLAEARPEVPVAVGWTAPRTHGDLTDYWTAARDEHRLRPVDPTEAAAADKALAEFATARQGSIVEVDPLPVLDKHRLAHEAGQRQAAAENPAHVYQEWQQPYTSGARVYRVEAQEGETFIHVFTPDAASGMGGRPWGQWMMRKSDLKNADGTWLTPAEIQQRFALPEAPTHFTVVLPPAGTPMNVGIAGTNGFGLGGAVQFQFAGRFELEWFGVPTSYPPEGAY